jgi:hypothetical protein
MKRDRATPKNTRAAELPVKIAREFAAALACNFAIRSMKQESDKRQAAARQILVI